MKLVGGPYTLRHTFATVGSNVRDREALVVIMGHKTKTMTDTYIHDFDETRLQAVVDHVREWLLAGRQTPEQATEAGGVLPFKAAAG